MGGGGFRPSPLFMFIFLFVMKKLCLKLEKNDKTMVRKKHSPHLGGGRGGGGGVWANADLIHPNDFFFTSLIICFIIIFQLDIFLYAFRLHLQMTKNKNDHYYTKFGQQNIKHGKLTGLCRGIPKKSSILIIVPQFLQGVLLDPPEKLEY